VRVLKFQNAYIQPTTTTSGNTTTKKRTTTTTTGSARGRSTSVTISNTGII